MRSDITRRVIALIEAVTNDRRRLKELEEETGIPSKNWKNVWAGNQRPTAHMLEALGRRWPIYGFWLLTGITDEKNGHTAPPNTWTCGQLRSARSTEESAKDYFEMKIYLQDSLYGLSSALIENITNTKQKRDPTDAECEAANITAESTYEEFQKFCDDYYGKDEPILTTKFKDIDEATAMLAFNQRLATIKNKIIEQHCDPEERQILVLEDRNSISSLEFQELTEKILNALSKKRT